MFVVLRSLRFHKESNKKVSFTEIINFLWTKSYYIDMQKKTTKKTKRNSVTGVSSYRLTSMKQALVR